MRIKHQNLNLQYCYEKLFLREITQVIYRQINCTNNLKFSMRLSFVHLTSTQLNIFIFSVTLF
ncbi:hypothetical protein BpHYR1_051720 [Brachionus plicatilis]|uniref:Uncharacterized protein n=1 Tax=Brachionus plicatilis TaxID=10195 RepID=A0A3M7PL31_BRAPC|nr:hypothetical protein BpHYR1_051720 [Brachionus plicatilis]